jgi:phospholipid-binding lipoprotein MlaA
MKTFPLLLLAAIVLAARVHAANPAEDGEFRDPFASDNPAAATPAIKISDPLEPVNRVVYQFNDKLYCWLLRPLAKGYRFVAPTPVRESVDRFFANVKYPVRGVNNLLEGRFKAAGIETARFVINTTVGIGGFFDPATRWKLKKQPAGFDQTLAMYGLPTGSFVMLPVFGPSSLRGTVGTAGDMALSPTLYLDLPSGVTIGASGLNTVNTTSFRVEDIDSLRAATLDPYAALRSAYFQSREPAR